MLSNLYFILEPNGKNVPQKFLLDLLDKAIEITKSAGKKKKGVLRSLLKSP